MVEGGDDSNKYEEEDEKKETEEEEEEEDPVDPLDEAEAARFFLLAHVLDYLREIVALDFHGKVFYDLSGSNGHIAAAVAYLVPDGGRLNCELATLKGDDCSSSGSSSSDDDEEEDEDADGYCEDDGSIVSLGASSISSSSTRGSKRSKKKGAPMNRFQQFKQKKEEIRRKKEALALKRAEAEEAAAILEEANAEAAAAEAARRRKKEEATEAQRLRMSIGGLGGESGGGGDDDVDGNDDGDHALPWGLNETYDRPPVQQQEGEAVVQTIEKETFEQREIREAKAIREAAMAHAAATGKKETRGGHKGGKRAALRWERHDAGGEDDSTVQTMTSSLSAGSRKLVTAGSKWQKALGKGKSTAAATFKVQMVGAGRSGIASREGQGTIQQRNKISNNNNNNDDEDGDDENEQKYVRAPKITPELAATARAAREAIALKEETRRRRRAEIVRNGGRGRVEGSSGFAFAPRGRWGKIVSFEPTPEAAASARVLLHEVGTAQRETPQDRERRTKKEQRRHRKAAAAAAAKAATRARTTIVTHVQQQEPPLPFPVVALGSMSARSSISVDSLGSASSSSIGSALPSPVRMALPPPQRLVGISPEKKKADKMAKLLAGRETGTGGASGGGDQPCWEIREGANFLTSARAWLDGDVLFFDASRALFCGVDEGLLVAALEPLLCSLVPGSFAIIVTRCLDRLVGEPEEPPEEERSDPSLSAEEAAEEAAAEAAAVEASGAPEALSAGEGAARSFVGSRGGVKKNHLSVLMSTTRLLCSGEEVSAWLVKVVATAATARAKRK